MAFQLTVEANNERDIRLVGIAAQIIMYSGADNMPYAEEFQTLMDRMVDNFLEAGGASDGWDNWMALAGGLMSHGIRIRDAVPPKVAQMQLKG